MGTLRSGIFGSLGVVAMLICNAAISLARTPSTARPQVSTRLGQTAPKESIREELIHLRERTGVILVTTIENRIYEVDVEKRSLKDVRTFYRGRAAAMGAISNRGNQVAFIIQTTPGTVQPSCPAATCLAVSGVDGSDFRPYADVAYPFGMCWSHDDSQLVLVAHGASKEGSSLGLRLLNLDTRLLREIDGRETFATSQCWSPDDSEIVYTLNKPVGIQTIRVYDTHRQQVRDLGNGGRATWSPDGKGVAVLHCPPTLQNCTYELVEPTSEARRPLFTTPAGQTPLWWSPDSRFVAYVSPIGPQEDRANAAAADVYRLRVRRLEDNAEDWVLNLSDKDALDFRWSTNRALAQP